MRQDVKRALRRHARSDEPHGDPSQQHAESDGLEQVGDKLSNHLVSSHYNMLSPMHRIVMFWYHDTMMVRLQDVRVVSLCNGV